MSDIIITVERISEILPHTNADSLEIAKVLGTQTCVPKGMYVAGDLVYFFPPDILIPEHVSEALGVQAYLRSCQYKGNKIKCRVAAARLRGEASYGFIARASGEKEGTDVTDKFEGIKYEPVIRCPTGTQPGGQPAREQSNFFKYTNIQHLYRNVNAFEDGELVCVTEKIHGTNSRVGIIKDSGEFLFVAGSHNVARKRGDDDYYHMNTYWHPLDDYALLELLTELCDEENDVIIYGELFGPSTQDMDYGVAQGELDYRVFDIMLNGKYMDWLVVKHLCGMFGVKIVPVLYEGPFDKSKVYDWTNGPTTFDPKCKFKGREGCVIKPVIEGLHCGARKIFKSVSVDYLSRKGAQDNE